MKASPSKIGTVAASAPGKIILTGEHFVVHGSYAVAAAINKRARVTVSPLGNQESEIVSEGKSSPVFADDNRFSLVKSVLGRTFEEYGKPKHSFRIQIDSEIPQGSGLGSSAAISVATSAAITSFIGQNPSKKQIWELSMRGERSVHGNPSGIDTWASLSGGIFLFNKKNGPKQIQTKGVLQFLVVFSGKTRRTSDLISTVSETRNKYPSSFEHLSKVASLLSLELVEAVTKGDLPYLGSLMDLTQLSLSRVGVSTKELDNLIESLLRGEAYGAKITGAGGGGSIIALPKPNMAKSLLRKVSLNYAHSFLTSIPQEGLRWET